MNKTVWTHILMLLVGAGIGFLAAKKLLEEHYAELAKEEIDCAKTIFKEKLNSIYGKQSEYSVFEKPKDEEKTEPDTAEKEKTEPEPDEKLPVGPKVIPQERSQTPYHEMYKRADIQEPADHKEEYSEDLVMDAAGYAEHDFIDCSASRKPASVDRSRPYVITDEEFSEECTNYDKVTLYYYTVDDVLCDEHEEIVDDIDNTVGWDCFHVLELQTTVWVRNEAISIDYEICSVRGSYAEMVHGIINPTQNLSPRERYQRKNKRETDEE